MRLVIDRARWIRNDYYMGNSYCALGFLANLTGGISSDAMLRCGRTLIPGELGSTQSLAVAIMKANDEMPDGLEREQRIADLFGKVGIDVEYVG